MVVHNLEKAWFLWVFVLMVLTIATAFIRLRAFLSEGK